MSGLSLTKPQSQLTGVSCTLILSKEVLFYKSAGHQSYSPQQVSRLLTTIDSDALWYATVELPNYGNNKKILVAIILLHIGITVTAILLLTGLLVLSQAKLNLPQPVGEIV